MKKHWKPILLLAAVMQMCAACAGNEGLPEEKESEEMQTVTPAGAYEEVVWKGETEAESQVQETRDAQREFAVAYLSALQAQENEPETFYYDYTCLGMSYGASLKDKAGMFHGYKDEVYTGEDFVFDIQYDVEWKEGNMQDLTNLFMVLINGVPQPFQWDGEEVTCVTVPMESQTSHENSRHTIAFHPAYVSDAEPVCMIIVHMIQNDTHFTSEHTFSSSAIHAWQFNVTAESPETAIDRADCGLDLTVSECGEPSAYEGSVAGPFSNQVLITNQPIREQDQMQVHTALESDGQLYAVFPAGYRLKQDQTKVYLYAFMDGKPAELLGDSWYGTLTADRGVVYEIPLDMRKIPSGDHLIWIAASSQVEQKTEEFLFIPAEIYDVKVP